MERAILLQLHDLILPHLDKDKGQHDQREADAMEARIAEAERKIEQTQEAMLAGDGMNAASVVALLSKLDAQKKKMGAALATLRGEIAAHASTNMDKTRERLAQVVDYYRRGKLDMTQDERVELRNVIAMTIARIEAKFERKKRKIIADDRRTNRFWGASESAARIARSAWRRSPSDT